MGFTGGIPSSQPPFDPVRPTSAPEGIPKQLFKIYLRFIYKIIIKSPLTQDGLCGIIIFGKERDLKQEKRHGIEQETKKSE